MSVAREGGSDLDGRNVSFAAGHMQRRLPVLWTRGGFDEHGSVQDTECSNWRVEVWLIVESTRCNFLQGAGGVPGLSLRCQYYFG